MKCAFCGYDMADGDVFCERCGNRKEPQQRVEQNFKYCENCGAKMNINSTFCSNCGRGKQPVNYGAAGNDKPKSPVNITLVVLLTAIIVLLSVILGFVLYGGGSDENEPSPTPQVTQTPMPTPTPTVSVVTPQPVQPQPHVNNTTQYQTRVDLYNPNLVYKRMGGIYNTYLTDDYTYYEITNVIHQFDSDCEDYMNGFTSVVPMALRRGSTAYNQQVDYKKKHPTLTQYYENINVINTRQGGGYYYAWVEETLRVTEKGATKVVTDRWVYKLSNTNGVWYIDDYTRDPSF